MTNDIVNNDPDRKRFQFAPFVIELVLLLTTIFFFYALAYQYYRHLMLSAEISITQNLDSPDGQARIGNINVLVMGVDSVDGTHRADTVFVLGINPAKGRISMLSIPRDTRVLIDGRARKINEILPRYGEAVIRSLIEDLMEIHISRFVIVDFQGFINIIDIIGGLEIDIEKAMHYDDNWGKLHIHFEKGLQKLDGRQALNYVRFRADANADLGRIERQQKFIRILIEKLLTPAAFVKLPQIIAQAYGHVQTDFSLQEIVALVRNFANLQLAFRSASLPGEARYIDKISYFLPYKDHAIEIGDSLFSDLSALEMVATFSLPLPKEEKNEN